MFKLPKISIITVVYNDKNNIAKTIESVINQTYPNIEYIIIDGGSTDGSLEIIKSYIHHSKDPTKHNITKLVSQKDNGIYDAMNKGIDLVTGEWCNFMNSGDVFYSNSVIEDLFYEYHEYKKTSNDNLVAIYGDTAIKIDENDFKIPLIDTNPKYRMPFCHQSVFVCSELLKKYKFDTSFKICADNDFFTKIYNMGFRFYQSNKTICIYDASGISSKPSWTFFSEELKIGQKYNKFYFPSLFVSYFSMLTKFYIKKILPRKLTIKIQKIYNAKRT